MLGEEGSTKSIFIEKWECKEYFILSLQVSICNFLEQDSCIIYNIFE